MFFRNGQGFLASSLPLGLASGATLSNVTMTGTLTGTGTARILMPDGTVTLPSYGWTSDDDTGLYIASGGMRVTHSNAQVFEFAAGAVNIPTGSIFTIASASRFQTRLALDSETEQTGNYTATATDAIVIMNAAALTLTLPATPAAQQLLFVRNEDAGNLTVGRNGKNINKAAADVIMAGNTASLFHYNGTEWFQITT